MKRLQELKVGPVATMQDFLGCVEKINQNTHKHTYAITFEWFILGTWLHAQCVPLGFSTELPNLIDRRSVIHTDRYALLE